MNIFIISPNPIWGGAATANMAIAEMLAKTHKVYYNDEYNIVNIPQVIYDSYPVHKLKDSRKLETYIIENKIDVVIWGVAMNIPYYRKAIKYLNRRGVVNCVIFHSLSIARNIKGVLMEWLIAYSLKYVDHLVFVSKYTDESWSKYKVVRNHPNHHTIYNPIAMGDYMTKELTYKIGFVGRFSAEKQPEQFARLSEFDNKNRYIAWGDGPLLTTLKEKYRKVEFKGQSSCQDSIYKSFDILVMTSEFENCPMVILEAWKYGIPCVVPAVGGIPEIVADGYAGRLYADYSQESILSCIKDIQDNYAQYRDNALHVVQNFSFKNIAECWDVIINSKQHK